MTKRQQQQRAVLAAVAELEPVAPSVELTPADRQEIREQVAAAIGPAIGVDAEAALNWMDAIRMSGP